MKPFNLINAVIATVMMFILSAFFMGVQLRLDGTKLVVGAAADIRWHWIFVGCAVVFLFQMLRPLWQKGMQRVSTSASFVLPSFDGSTMRQNS